MVLTAILFFISLSISHLTMQKLITIPLLALYVLASIGINGVSHFCGNEFIGVALFEEEDEMACGDDACCSLPDSDTECCTEVEFALFFESEKPLTMISSRFMVKTSVSSVIPNFTVSRQDYQNESWKPDDIDDPGNLTSNPLYLQHQSLIFYG